MRNLTESIQKHKMWLESQGKGGEQLFLKEQNLSGLDLSGIDLTQSVMLGVNFDFAIMNNICLDYANLGHSSFKSAILNSSSLVKAEANHACFEMAKFCNGNAFRSTFIGTCFKGADLRGMNFSNCLLSNADFSDANINGCKFHNVYFKDIHGMETSKFDWIEVTELEGVKKIYGYDEIILLRN